jgi:hypothetical protein
MNYIRSFVNWLCKVKGTFDVTILKKDYSKGQEANGARLLFELKKVGNIKERERHQAQLQLILANYWSIFHVLVILTDLNDHWEIMIEIMTCFPSRDLAIHIIQEYINKENESKGNSKHNRRHPVIEMNSVRLQKEGNLIQPIQ